MGGDSTHRMTRGVIIFAVAFCALVAFAFAARAHEGHTVIVFWKTAGFVHDDMAARAAEVAEVAEAEGYHVITTADSTIFNDADLADVEAVIFVSSSGSLMTLDQRAAFQTFVESGGGFVGVHSPGDANNNWDFWNDLVGSDFVSDPSGQHAGTVLISDPNHPSTVGLPDRWDVVDSFANYLPHPRETVHVLATADLRSLKGSLMGPDHPVAWCHVFGASRSWTTLLGHPTSMYTDTFFRLHLAGGINWATGEAPGDCDATVESNYQKVTLDDVTTDPMELDILPDGRVLWIERNGAVKLYNPTSGSTSLIHDLDPYQQWEDGLLGMTLDPSFSSTGWVWLYYSPKPASANKNVLSRFTFTGSSLTNEVVYLEVPTDRTDCCPHAGGSLAFDPQGRLYLSTGDNTHHSPFGAYDETSPSNDAQRTSANTNDLRGKILRIDPNSDGTYAIPAGNLFAPGTPLTRPEIYLMGLRNPFRLSIDPDTGWLYTADVGPDAKNANSNGPPGHDEIIQARQAGNHGWPHCIADNLPYLDPNEGVPYDCANPTNDSPHNTGADVLPASKSAFIWYSFSNAYNVDWPEVSDAECTPPIQSACGNTAMVGPVYHRPTSPSPDALPAHYEDRLFIYEWTRDWIKTARLDNVGNVIALEPFLPSLAFKSPIDMEVGPDGVLYFLEYGTGFGSNDDASLSKIVYQPENRSPVASITADTTSGGVPLTVSFSGSGSTDPEEGTVSSYAWDFDGNGTVDSTAPGPSHTFATTGDFTVTLTVTDSLGAEGSTSVVISAGNNAPVVELVGPADGGFFGWQRPVPYTIVASDAEDDPVNPADVTASSFLGHDSHAHPISSQPGTSGSFSYDRTGHTDLENVFGVLEGSYSDSGTGSNGPLSGSDSAVLYPYLRQAEFHTSSSGISLVVSQDDPDGGADVGSIDDGDWIALDPVALNGIHSITARLLPAAAGTITYRQGNPAGPILGSATVPAGSSQTYVSLTTPITASSGTTALYVVFDATGSDTTEILQLNWLYFNGDGVAAPDTTAPSLVAASGAGNTVTVEFNEPVDQQSAEDHSAYSIDAGVTVNDAVLSGDLTTVILSTSTLADGDYTVTVSGVEDRSTAGNPVPAGSSIDFTAGSTGGAEVLFRVNIGGPLVAATDGGPDWAVDTAANPYPGRVAGNQISTWPAVTNVDASVPSTTPTAVFSTERYDPAAGAEMQWNFAVASGTELEVRLYFANGWSGTDQPGERVFDVIIDGTTVLNDYDIAADVGHQIGVMKSFNITADGNIDIDFGHVTQNPLINAIEIIGFNGQPPANLPPSITAIANQTMTEGGTLTVNVAASDPDGDTLTLTDSGTPSFGSFTDNGDGTGTFTFNPATGNNGTYNISVTATDPDNATDTEPFTLTVDPGPTGGAEVLFRVNIGGPLVAATDGGPDWAVDTAANPYPGRVAGNQISTWPAVTNVDASVPSTTPTAVFSTERYDPSAGAEMQWNFAVASGTDLEVRLYFANGWSGTDQPGERVFDVIIDGATVLNDYDIAADVGHQIGVMKSFNITADGNIDIDFGHVTQNPLINAIEIIELS